MAGYFLYSLDFDKLTSFLTAPAGKPLTKLAELVSDSLDEYDDELEDGEIVAEWPIDPAELKPILKARIELDDWYSDLSNTGKQIWEQSFTGVCLEESLLGFRCECDGIYWNIVEEAKKFHGVGRHTASQMELTHFGTRPFHYQSPEKMTYDSWVPYHSMHTPDEVRQLIKQFSAAEQTILASKHQEVREDYAALMPALESIAAANRVLYVAVDT